MAVPAFWLTSASLTSILNVSCSMVSAEKAILVESWLLRECRVQARSEVLMLS